MGTTAGSMDEGFHPHRFLAVRDVTKDKAPHGDPCGAFFTS